MQAEVPMEQDAEVEVEELLDEEEDELEEEDDPVYQPRVSNYRVFFLSFLLSFFKSWLGIVGGHQSLPPELLGEPV